MPLYLLEGPQINKRPFGIMTLSRKEGVPIVSSLDMWVTAHSKALEPGNIPLAWAEQVFPLFTFHVPCFPFWPTPNWWYNSTGQSKCSKERFRAFELFGGLLWTLVMVSPFSAHGWAAWCSYMRHPCLLPCGCRSWLFAWLGSRLQYGPQLNSQACQKVILQQNYDQASTVTSTFCCGELDYNLNLPMGSQGTTCVCFNFLNFFSSCKSRNQGKLRGPKGGESQATAWTGFL